MCSFEFATFQTLFGFFFGVKKNNICFVESLYLIVKVVFHTLTQISVLQKSLTLLNMLCYNA